MMTSHIHQKPGGSVWYVRIQVPPDVRHAFGGRTKLIKTTGTSSKAEAMIKRLPILAMWTAQIAQARADKLGARELWREETALIGQDIKAARDRGILNAINTPPEPPAVGSRDEAVALIEQHKRSIYQALEELRQFEAMGATGLSESVVQRLNNQPDATPLEQVQFTTTKLQETLVQMTHHRVGLTATEIAEAKMLATKPETYKPVSPITPTRLAAFRTYRQKADIAAKTIDQQESKLQKLSDYLRDQGKPLLHDTVSAWLDTLSLSSKTKVQYLLAGATFWKWALKHDTRWRDEYTGQNNPFTEQDLPQVRGKAKADAARKAFTPEELQRIYDAAKAVANQNLCDLITFGAYTGCRIEELAQLRAESVVAIEGIASFKIADSKTAAGIREIPIHPVLAVIVDRLKSSTSDGYLLPGSSGKGNQYGIRSDSLSKAFGRLKSAQGFGRQHVFHSVRAMVITQLARAEVPGTTIANIVGHETGIVTFDVYDEGASPRQKLDALMKLPTLTM